MSTVEEAVLALQEGKFVVVADDKDRENEGDLILAAEKATPESMAMMVRNTSGIICVAMLEERLSQLKLPQMVQSNTEPHQTAFTVSVDYLPETTTGISAKDRCHTIRALANEDVRPEDFCRPGHIFPLRYREGGVLKRAGHTEASVDLMRLAGLYPAGVISEIVNDDGTVAKGQKLIDFAKKHEFPIISVADIIRYRRKHEKLVSCISTARIPTKWGEFTACVYQSHLDDIEHLALVKGDIDPQEEVLVRVHSECLTGDILGSTRCDCGTQLQGALEQIAKSGHGVCVYLRGHEGRGIGLAHKLRAYTLQDKGLDTVEANEKLGLPVDSREYGIGAQILCDLGVKKICLLTNNPAKYGGLEGYDLEITRRAPLIGDVTDENTDYLQTKQDKLGHLLQMSLNPSDTKEKSNV
jgi:3,4-dihydroxy 2-butanone 4-phosphate synthase/GTP cyclohydrolase II